jgi:4-hydroxy-4-methyl-2-oxoglutarate aldolase
VRDVEGIDEVGLPTFARGTHPATGSNEGPGAINVPVQLGGVAVRPGDVVRGDASGVVVVPREHLDSVIALTRAVEQREAAWRQAVADGVSLAAATGVDAVIAERSDAAATPLP